GGCNTQYSDSQSAGSDPVTQPASAPGTSDEVPGPNEYLDDSEASAFHARKLREDSLARFRAEPVDSGWASTTRSAILVELSKVSENLPATVNADSVECHQKTCLVEVVHPDESTLFPVRDQVIKP